MALTRKLARGDSSGSAPTSIANKEAAYALTGVAVGTKYKTEDTGQVMEYLGVAANASFVISSAGSPAEQYGNNLDRVYKYPYAYGEYGDDTGDAWVDYKSGRWVIGYQMDDAFQSDLCDASVHPVDATGWTAINSATGTIADDGITYTKNPWKLDGVISVYENDEKQLLTNLPDDQQVKITGEGGRIEQLPPSPLPDIKRGFIISDAGNPRSSVSDGGSSVSGAFFWHETDSQFVRDDDGGYYAAYVVHDGSRWQIGYQMGYFFQSDLCASTVHPADATGWTAYDAGGGIGQGTIADDGLVKTRACEVYNSPQYKSSGNTLWFTIKNTVYLTVNDAASSGGYDVNGVTVANGAVQGIGWVQVGERVTTTKSTILYKLSKVDEDTTFTFGATVIDMVTVGYDFTLPDVLPNGGTVEIKNA